MSLYKPPDILRDVAGFGERLRFSEVLLSRVRRAPEYQWANIGTAGAPAFGDGWSNSPNDPTFSTSPAGYFKTRDGWMYFRGAVVSASGAVATIFTLPLGYRPPNREVGVEAYGIHTITRDNALIVEGVSIRIDILPSGEVQIQGGAGPFPSGLPLGGLRFRSYVPTY